MTRVMNLIARHRLLALLITALWATGMHAQRTYKAMINGQETDVKCVQLWKWGPYFAEMNIGASNPMELGTRISYNGPWWTEDINGTGHMDIRWTQHDPAGKMWGDGWMLPSIHDIESFTAWCDVERVEEPTVEDAYHKIVRGYFIVKGKDEGYTDRKLYIPYIKYIYLGDAGHEGDHEEVSVSYSGALLSGDIRYEHYATVWDPEKGWCWDGKIDGYGGIDLYIRAVVKPDVTEIKKVIEEGRELHEYIKSKGNYQTDILARALQDAEHGVKTSNSPEVIEYYLEKLNEAIEDVRKIVNEKEGHNSGTIDTKYYQDNADDAGYVKNVIPPGNYTASILQQALVAKIREKNGQFKDQADCNAFTYKVRQTISMIRELAGVTPYDDYVKKNLSPIELDNMVESARRYLESIGETVSEVKGRKVRAANPDAAEILKKALEAADKSVGDISTQEDIDAISKELEVKYNEARAKCGDQPFRSDAMKTRPADGIYWQEDFSGFAIGEVPCEGPNLYAVYSDTGETKVLDNNRAGGTAPELNMASRATFKATVPLNGAYGKFTLSYQAKNISESVVRGGEQSDIYADYHHNTYKYYVTVPKGTKEVCIRIKNTLSSIGAIDDIKFYQEAGDVPDDLEDIITPSDSIGGGGGDIIIPGDSIGGGGGDIIIPGDSIGGGGGDIITPSDSIGGGSNPDQPTSVNLEAYRKLYLDYLNYYYDHVRNHHIATWLYNYVERECDRLDDHFENQEACDNLYAYLLEKFNIIREMVGDTPYNGTSYKPQNFNTEKLDALAIHAEAYYDKIHVSHTGPAYNLSDALRDALLATYEIKTQADIENIYAKLLEEYNDVRRRCGDGPYGEDDEEADSDNPDYANLNSAIRRSGWFIEDLEADSKYADIMGELQNALDEAKKALESKKQSVIDAAAQALEDALLKAQNDKKEMDKQPEVADEEGTPMAPIAPDLTQYTHKMMVHGSPWGINGLNMIMLRDKQGRLVQTMTVEARNGGMEEVLTDSVRTYTYDANKMTEQLSVPEYDSNDVLTLIPMSRKETSYYRLADGGHREVCLEMREDDGVCTPIRKTVTVFDAQGRKLSLKHYALWNGEELEYYYDYTYDEDGGFYTKGQNDWGENIHTYTCYDKNGNQTYKTDYNGLYIYGWDEQNHAQGYKFYRNYNIEDNTCTSVDDSRYYIITEKDAEGRTLTMRNGTGGTKSFTYNGNQETETVSDNGTITTYVRTFDADGRLLKMEKNGTALISEFEWSNLDADKVLGGVNKVDENMNWQISKGTTYWTSDKALISARRRYTFEGWQDDDKTTYNIVPLSLLPAQTTDEGVSIPLGNEGDQITLSSDGEIYLLDKGGKKRYSVSVAGITVSSEGGKITITGWTPVDPSASVKGARRAPEKVNLDGNEYDIYIPQDVVSINDEPMNDLYIPIVMDDIADGITGVATANNGRIYNLQGMEVKNPTKGQIVIIKGRKVLMTK